MTNLDIKQQQQSQIDNNIGKLSSKKRYFQQREIRNDVMKTESDAKCISLTTSARDFAAALMATALLFFWYLRDAKASATTSASSLNSNWKVISTWYQTTYSDFHQLFPGQNKNGVDLASRRFAETLERSRNHAICHSKRAAEGCRRQQDSTHLEEDIPKH